MAAGRDLAPFHRDQALTEIKLGMRRLRVSHCLSLLTKYGLPETRKIGKFYEDYLPLRLNVASNHQLAALNSVLKTKYATGSSLLDKYGTLADDDQVRIYISHAGAGRARAVALKETLALGGLTGFVSLDDREGAPEWMVETISQLEHMDVLLSLIDDQAHTSAAANQEVGFALGAGVPVLSLHMSCVRQEITKTPMGLAASLEQNMWAADETVKSIALKAVEWMLALPQIGPRVTDRLVRQIVAADKPHQAFQEIGFCRKALLGSSHLLANQIYELRKAARENPEIARFASGRGPELISALCDEWEEKARAV